ncbi:MAG: prolyl oligopeptidase family serine peptidase, partial [Akkermansiaceae bacterium]|nr:prolyl oligopeptidase family serine peptidase [Akkermansiaceae bacterium]
MPNRIISTGTNADNGALANTLTHMPSRFSAAFTRPTGEAHWEPLLRARAIENLCGLVAAAQVGRHVNGRDTYGHSHSRKMLLGEEPDANLVELLSNDERVTADDSTDVLFHTNEDAGVPAENSIAFYSALRRAGVPAELHIYQRGPHGVGLAPGDPVLGSWKDRLADWLKSAGFL